MITTDDVKKEWLRKQEEDKRVECSRCGEKKECELIRDPYINEMFPEDRNEPEWRCEDCADQRRGDI